MAKKTKRGHQQVRKGQLARKVSWASKASVDTTDTENSDESGLLGMIASGMCGCLISPEYDSYEILSSRGGGKNNSVDTDMEVGCMPYSPSCQDIGDFFHFGGPPMKCVYVKNRCNSVDGSELTMPRAIVRMAHHNDAYNRELVRSSAVTLEPMNLPTTGWLSLKKSNKSIRCADSSTGSRGSKNSRRSKGSRSGANVVRVIRPAEDMRISCLTPNDMVVQLRKTNSKLYEI
jgi:hypothetical protein